MTKSLIKYNVLIGLVFLSAIVLMLIGLGCCGEVAPPCSNDAFVLEPMPFTTKYTAGPMLDAGTYKIWSGVENSDGSIAWKLYGPVQLKGKTSYVFDAAEKELGVLNPLNVDTYPSQAVVTLKCVHYDQSYGVCFEKIPSTVGPGEVAPPCSNDAFVLEPMPFTTEYTAGPMLDAGTYKIWSGVENSDGSIAWKLYGPVQLKGKTSYVFDAAKKELWESNPLNVDKYPSQAIVTLKCVHYDQSYGVCFEKVQSAVGPGEVASMPGANHKATLSPGWDIFSEPLSNGEVVWNMLNRLWRTCSG